MTQSIVPFFSSVNSAGNSVDPTVIAKVFDGQISTNAQSFYIDQMTNMQDSINDMRSLMQSGQFILIKPGLPPVPTSDVDGSDTFVNSAFIDDITSFYNSLNALNGWSGLVTADLTTGVQNAPAWNATTSGSTPNAFDPNSFRFSGSPTGASNQVAFVNPPVKITTTMSQYMAQALEQINRLLSVPVASRGYEVDSFAAFNPNSPPAASNLLFKRAALNLQILLAVNPSPAAGATDTTVYQLPTLLATGLSAAQQARLVNNASTQSKSIQEALAVDYIADGNQLIFDRMDGLNKAINQNQQILQFLNGLQDLINRKDPQQFALKFGALSNQSLGTAGIQDTQFDSFEQDSFNQQLSTIARGFTGDNASTLTDANALINDAFKTYSSLGDVSANAGSYVRSVLITNITNLVTALLNTGTTSGSGLVTALNAVKTDLNAATSLQAWVQDFTATGTTSGNNQQNLSNAVSAAQSFNQTQQSQLQQAMFVFQQFYQSASGLLSQIHQIIRNMATAISK